MDLFAYRFSYADTDTESKMQIPDGPIYFLEQSWTASASFPAGVPYHSCIPDGKYDLIPYVRKRANKPIQNCWALVNEALGVCFRKADREYDWQRFKCLWHPGNLVEHTEGCPLPGNSRGGLQGKRAVKASGYRDGYAMDRLTKLLGELSSGHTVTIAPSPQHAATFLGLPVEL